MNETSTGEQNLQVGGSRRLGQRTWLAIIGVLIFVIGGVVGWAAAGLSSDDEDDAQETATSDDGTTGAGNHDEHGAEHDHAAETQGDDGLDTLLADHHYEPPPAEPPDNEARQLLTAQLMATQGLVESYPTLADAEADDWYRAGPFIPGLGTHYLPRNIDRTFTIPGVNGDGGEETRPVLIFDGLEPDSPLAGFMLLALGDEAPEGFVGPYDRWHQHTNVCIVRTDEAMELPFVADLDNVTEEMCADRGGTLTDVSSHMVHVWSVPGYGSELGTFAEVNPRITCPDGTYHRVPYDQLETDETTCQD